MKKGIRIKQYYENDCGVAALASVSAFFGRRESLAVIRVNTNSSYEGTTIGGIISGAKHLNIEANGYKGDISALENIKEPAILHIRKANNLLHFIVLYKYSNGLFTIMDPSDGRFHKLSTDSLKDCWSGYLVLLKKGPDFKKGNNSINLYSHFATILKNEWLNLLYILLLSLSFLVVAGSTSYFIKILTDSIIPHNNLQMLKTVGLWAIIIIITSLVFSYFRSVISLKMGLRIDKKIITKFLGHTIKLPQKFFDLRKSGEISSRIFESYRVRVLITEISISFIFSAVTLIAAFFFMFSIYKPLTIITLLFIPLYIGIYLLFDKTNKENIWKVSEEMSGFESFINDTYKSVKTIKYFGLEEFYRKNSELIVDKLNSQLYKSGINFVLSAALNDTLTKILSFTILLAGAGFVINNKLTTGDWLSFFTLLALFSTPLSQIANIGKEVRSGLVIASRIFEIIELEDEWTNKSGKNIPNTFKYISLENIFFKYPNRQNLLDNFSIQIDTGSIVALYGKNGSGKSTVTSILTSLYNSDSGIITIDGTDIKEYSLKEWRNMISIVPQKLEILTGTILENIVPGDTNIDFKYLYQIIDELELTNFFKILPKGIETILTENSSLISRGEQQRIAVARAIYRRPKLLILDEATASLDANSESNILKMVLKMKEQGCMILMITHRESDLEIADKIVRL